MQKITNVELLPENIFGSTPKPLHLGISVSNLEESVKWYSETLGFTLVKRADLSAHLRIVIVEYQGFGVELIEVRGSQANPLRGTTLVHSIRDRALCILLSRLLTWKPPPVPYAKEAPSSHVS